MDSRTFSSSRKPLFRYTKLRIWIWPRLPHFSSMSTKWKVVNKDSFPPHSGTQVWLSGNCGTQPGLQFPSVVLYLWSSASCSWIQWFAKVEAPGPSTLQDGFFFLSTFQNKFIYWWSLSLGSHLSEICSNKKTSLDLIYSQWYLLLHSSNPFSSFLIFSFIHLFIYKAYIYEASALDPALGTQHWTKWTHPYHYRSCRLLERNIFAT